MFSQLLFSHVASLYVSSFYRKGDYNGINRCTEQSLPLRKTYIALGFLFSLTLYHGLWWHMPEELDLCRM